MQKHKKSSTENDKCQFLNKNGKLDLYEDYREPIESRLDDLLSQMTLEEKAGTMFINIIGMKLIH